MGYGLQEIRLGPRPLCMSEKPSVRGHLAEMLWMRPEMANTFGHEGVEDVLGIRKRR